MHVPTPLASNRVGRRRGDVDGSWDGPVHCSHHRIEGEEHHRRPPCPDPTFPRHGTTGARGSNSYMGTLEGESSWGAPAHAAVRFAIGTGRSGRGDAPRGMS